MSESILIIDTPTDIDFSKCQIGGDGNIYYDRKGERCSIIGNIKNVKQFDALDYIELDEIIHYLCKKNVFPWEINYGREEDYAEFIDEDGVDIEDAWWKYFEMKAREI